MRTFLTLAAAFLLAPALSAQGIIPSGKTFLKPLQPRDSVLVADQFEYGFVMEDVPEGATFALPDLSKGMMEGVETSGSWRVDSLLTRQQRKALRKGEKVPVSIQVSTVVAPFEEGLFQLPPLAIQRSLEFCFL